MVKIFDIHNDTIAGNSKCLENLQFPLCGSIGYISCMITITKELLNEIFTRSGNTSRLTACRKNFDAFTIFETFILSILQIFDQAQQSINQKMTHFLKR